MRVVILIESFPYFSETFIYNQFKELLNKGIDVYLYYFKPSGVNVNHSVVKLIEKSGRLEVFRKRVKPFFFYNLIKFPFKSFLLLKHFQSKRSLFYIANLDFLMNIENSHILHTHFGRMGEISGTMFEVGVFKKVKLVNSFHGVDILPSKISDYKLEYRNLIKYSSLCIANSQYSRDIIAKIDRKLIDKLVVLPVGVDFSFFLNYKSQQKKSFEVIYVGRLIDFKGAINVLKIARKITKQIDDIHFHIIGDGGDYDFLVKYSCDNNLDSFVSFHKALPHEQLISFYMRSSVFLLPGVTISDTGRAENQGLVIQEAQAMGLPVVISDAGGMKEGVVDGVSGFVVPEDDIDQFSDKILFFYKNRNLIQSFGYAGNRFVNDYYSNSFITDRLIKIYFFI